ncbi:hypothetical protein GCM10027563_46700 [Parasphingorhabdus pacifica]
MPVPVVVTIARNLESVVPDVPTSDVHYSTQQWVPISEQRTSPHGGMNFRDATAGLNRNRSVSNLADRWAPTGARASCATIHQPGITR